MTAPGPARVLIVGGTGGVGRAVAALLTRSGSRVAVTSRSIERAGAVVGAGDAEAAVALDLGDLEGVRGGVEEVAQAFGGMDGVVTSAGPVVPQRHLSTVEPSEMSHHLELEAAGFFAVAHAALPHLRESGGAIVAVTSAATDRYAVRDGLSAGPKGAVEALVRGLAAEEGRFGVRVNAVGPGMLADGMASGLIASGHYDDEALEIARRNIGLKRFGTCGEVAAVVGFLLSDSASYVSGQVLNVDGAYSV